MGRIGLVTLALLCVGCSTPSSADREGWADAHFVSPGTEAVLPRDPTQDPQYAPILKQWTRHAVLYQDLLLQFQGYATLMTPQMQEAYHRRLEGLQGEGTPPLADLVADENTWVVVLSFFTPQYTYLDLHDNKLWNIGIQEAPGRWIAPQSIKRYRQPEPLVGFFNRASAWDRMYILRFPKSSDSHEVLLRLGSSAAVVTFKWP